MSQLNRILILFVCVCLNKGSNKVKNYKNPSFSSWLFQSSIVFGAKIEISGTKCVEKTPIYIFSIFGSKINEFERKKSEKNEKIPKT